MKKLVLTLSLLCLISGAVYAEFPGKISGTFRSFYFDRTYIHLQESLAIGGWLQYDSPSWQGIKLTIAEFTSQPLLINKPQYGGGNILGPSQEGVSSLGLANISAQVGSNKLVVFRQALDTPFINQHDNRMLPKLVEAYSLYINPNPKVSILAAYVSKIKGWSSTEFVPMSQFAGYAGTNRGVALAGIVLNPNEKMMLQAWNYYCEDFMNVVYLNYVSQFPVNDSFSLRGGIQSFIQRSIGEEIGGKITTGMIGLKGTGQWKNGANISLAYSSTNKDHDIVNPSWGGYAGYTAILEEDSDLAGEKAWALGLENNICKVGPGNLVAKLYHSQAYIDDDGSFADPRQRETDLTFEYQLSQNYYWRLRGSVVKNSKSMGDLDYSSLRFNVNYGF